MDEVFQSFKMLQLKIHNWRHLKVSGFFMRTGLYYFCLSHKDRNPSQNFDNSSISKKRLSKRALRWKKTFDLSAKYFESVTFLCNAIWTLTKVKSKVKSSNGGLQDSNFIFLEWLVFRPVTKSVTQLTHLELKLRKGQVSYLTTRCFQIYRNQYFLYFLAQPTSE